MKLKIKDPVTNEWMDIFRPTDTEGSTASKLFPGANIQIDLSSPNQTKFDGSTDVNPGVSGVLSINNGGTGGSDAATARANLGITVANIGAAPQNHNHDNSYLKLSGGTLTGDLTIKRTSTIANNYPAVIKFSNVQSDNSVTTSGAYIAVYDDHDAHGYGSNMVIQSAGNVIIGSGESPSNCYSTDLLNNTGENLYLTSDGLIQFYTNCQTYTNKKATCKIDINGAFWGAVWNDYAEFRDTVTPSTPGYCVVEVGDDTLKLSSRRLEKGAMIISDTFGFAIGETENCKTPIAVAGRVLAYTNEPREEYKQHIGDCVCAGPEGKICIMTDEEARNYPAAILGTISAVPDYEEWGTGNIKVDGRVWIKVR